MKGDARQPPTSWLGPSHTEDGQCCPYAGEGVLLCTRGAPLEAVPHSPSPLGFPFLPTRQTEEERGLSVVSQGPVPRRRPVHRGSAPGQATGGAGKTHLHPLVADGS